MAQIVDFYNESNYDSNDWSIYRGTSYLLNAGQSFTGNGGILNSIKIYVCRVSSSTSNVYARIYSERHSTAYGTDSLPNTLLATSDPVVASVLSASNDFALTTFNFSGANKITLANGTNYVLVIEFDENNGSYLRWGNDPSSPTHSGNASAVNQYSGVWQVSSAWDFCFYVYKDDLTGPFPTFKQTTS